jgi:hypothetical protein
MLQLKPALWPVSLLLELDHKALARKRDERERVNRIVDKLEARLADRGDTIPRMILRSMAEAAIFAIDLDEDDRRVARPGINRSSFRFVGFTTNDRGEMVAEFLVDGPFRRGRPIQYTKNRLEAAVASQLNRHAQQYEILKHVLQNWGITELALKPPPPISVDQPTPHNPKVETVGA